MARMCLDGPAIERMSEAELAAAVARVSVFARIVPAQKLRIVQAFKAHGAVVAMTGDGVNDAPSLKAADIGIAMGGRGTDVAREASSLVLLDDDFGSIVRTIRLGRRIYDNLRKAMAYIIAVHVPIAGLALLPLLTGLPLHLRTGAHRLSGNGDRSGVLDGVRGRGGGRRHHERPPRAATSPLFSPALVAWSLLQGTIAFMPLAALYGLAIQRGLPEDGRAFAHLRFACAGRSRPGAGQSFLRDLPCGPDRQGEPRARVGRCGHGCAAGSRANLAC